MLPFEYSLGGRLLIPFRANNSLPPRPLRQRMRRPEALVPAQINATSKWSPPPNRRDGLPPFLLLSGWHVTMGRLSRCTNSETRLRLCRERRDGVPLPDGDEGVDLSGWDGR